MRKLLWGAFLLWLWPVIKAKVSDRVASRKKKPARKASKGAGASEHGRAQAEHRMRTRNRG